MTRLAVITAVCLLASGCAIGRDGLPRGTATYHGPQHRVAMQPELTRLFSPGELAAPLTITCPGDAPGRGVKQVIRSALTPGFGALYGDSQLANSLRIDVSGDGAVSITCT